MAKEPATLAMVIQLLNRQGREIDLMHHELHQIFEKVTIMQAEWDNLIDKVSKLTTVTDGVRAVVDKLLEIINTGPTLEAVRKAAAEIGSNVDELGEAVAKGTPADPNAPPA